jgi:hypothetical protein
MADLPPNIQEFNTIAGLIFAQLYPAFPVLIDLIDRPAIAKAMDVTEETQLSSGRTFNLVLSYTIAWLNAEDYIRSSGAHPAERVVLSTRGLVAMNAVPPGLRRHIIPVAHVKLIGVRRAHAVATVVEDANR